jgi:antitoxin ParD1/3/4
MNVSDRANKHEYDFIILTSGGSTMHTVKAERVTITLPPDMLATIKDKVQSGAYGSTSEVIREAMRFWQQQQEEHATRLALIRNRLAASAQSDNPVPLEDAFKAIERMHQQRMKTAGNEKI